MAWKFRPSDLRGISLLAVEATAGVTDLVEAMHYNIADVAGAPAHRVTRGITGLVYRGIRGVTRLVGGGLDEVLARAVARLGEGSSPPGREAVLAALNGVLGDHLAASGNPLAIPMRLRRFRRAGLRARRGGEGGAAGPRAASADVTGPAFGAPV